MNTTITRETVRKIKCKLTDLTFALFCFWIRYNVLVATDAIGMGLHLNIGRVIFDQMMKYDGTSVRWLTLSEIKQASYRSPVTPLIVIRLQVQWVLFCLTGKIYHSVTSHAPPINMVLVLVLPSIPPPPGRSQEE